MGGRVFLLSLLPIVTLASAQSASPACTPVRTAVDLNRIRDDLADHYCLTRNIDAGSIANFLPIGSSEAPFTGTLNGNGHAIRNLTISSSLPEVGLFGHIANGAIKSLRLLNVQITGSGVGYGSSVGAVAGVTEGDATITDVHVTGAVLTIGSPDGQNYFVGGLAGKNAGTISRSSENGTTLGPNLYARVGGIAGANGGSIEDSRSAGKIDGYDAGGLVALNYGQIHRSYATGSQSGKSVGWVGGIAGYSAGSIVNSYASGTVRGGIYVGGLVGWSGGAVENSYATGRAVGTGGIGGLVGNSTGSVLDSLSVGPVVNEDPNLQGSGGLIGPSSSGTVLQSYWDIETSGQDTSAGGTGKSTRQLMKKLPGGFDSMAWAITPGVTFPYLTVSSIDFVSLLATTVFADQVFVFLPISQLDESQYAGPVVHSERASLATVYTMLARAIGVTQQDATLEDVKIDTYFWSDTAKKTSWVGPISQYLNLGERRTIGQSDTIDDSNVVGALRKHNVAVIGGAYLAPGGRCQKHWMLATSFTVDAAGAIGDVIANDPWTGKQVKIDPRTKSVVSPPDFPLANFSINQYRVVSFKQVKTSQQMSGQFEQTLSSRDLAVALQRRPPSFAEIFGDK